MSCTGGIGHALSGCLLGCGTQDEAEDEAEVCVLCCQDAPPSQFVMSVRSTIVLNVFLELGQFGSPNSKGVSKGCAWGLFGGNIV